MVTPVGNTGNLSYFFLSTSSRYLTPRAGLFNYHVVSYQSIVKNSTDMTAFKSMRSLFQSLVFVLVVLLAGMFFVLLYVGMCIANVLTVVYSIYLLVVGRKIKPFNEMRDNLFTFSSVEGPMRQKCESRVEEGMHLIANIYESLWSVLTEPVKLAFTFVAGVVGTLLLFVLSKEERDALLAYIKQRTDSSSSSSSSSDAKSLTNSE